MGNDQHERAASVFLGEALSQIEVALRAHTRVQEAERDGDDDALWDAVDQLLTASIRVVNIFWSSRSGEPKRRAERLRTLFSLPSTPPSDSLRDVRNGFEHFDERIDVWSSKLVSVYVGRLHLSADPSVPLSSIISVGGGSADHEHFARVYRSHGQLSVFSKSVSLPEVVSALRDLRSILQPFSPFRSH